MGQDLSDEEIKWFVEKHADQYLAWIGLWLVCLLGNVTMLTSLALTTPQPSLASGRFWLLGILYFVLVIGMIFATGRIAVTLESNYQIVKKMKDSALKTRLLDNRSKGLLSKFVFDDNGVLRKFRVYCLIGVQVGFFILLYALALK
jgi:hypothetical protein